MNVFRRRKGQLESKTDKHERFQMQHWLKHHRRNIISLFVQNRLPTILVTLIITAFVLFRDSSPSAESILRKSESPRRPRIVISPLDGKPKTIPTTSSENAKHILYYTKYWDGNDFLFGEGSEPFKLAKCPVSNCFVTGNRAHLPSMGNFDAVFFHGHYDGVSRQDLEDIHNWRKPHQYFIIMLMESPLYGKGTIPARSGFDNSPNDPFDNFFNWTMGYRWDSDIPRPYGWFKERDSRGFYQSNPDSWIQYNRSKFLESLVKKPSSFRSLASRPKMVAWVVSNCLAESFREDYVDELKRYIPVDVFGKCSKTPCDKGYDSFQLDNCTRVVKTEYKFYLSFENAFCNDYVTEKFFGRISDNLVIVMGQANYSRFSPPHSHLNVMDFPSPKALAQYLHRLANDPIEYLSYFWWKDYYEVMPVSFSRIDRNLAFARAMCRLCERLHRPHESRSVYSNLQEWWRDESECNRDLPKLLQRIQEGSNVTGYQSVLRIDGHFQ